MTQGHLERELVHNHGPPPTPDTISTSTLRRFKSSSDTLPRAQSLTNMRSYLALSETTTSQISVAEEAGELRNVACPEPPSTAQTTQPASTTAFDSRMQPPTHGATVDCPLSSPSRARSADGISSSHRRDDWTSDDSEDFEGTDSTPSSFDPRLKESQKRNRVDALDRTSSASQAVGIMDAFALTSSPSWSAQVVGRPMSCMAPWAVPYTWGALGNTALSAPMAGKWLGLRRVSSLRNRGD
ncbi:hypothetical protein DL768_001954 [Monosporascus sp. mg162]|nr:hypothetical protein DL768_001954 [Monosporascus sp. mg162]